MVLMNSASTHRVMEQVQRPLLDGGTIHQWYMSHTVYTYIHIYSMSHTWRMCCTLDIIMKWEMNSRCERLYSSNQTLTFTCNHLCWRMLGFKQFNTFDVTEKLSPKHHLYIKELNLKHYLVPNLEIWIIIIIIIIVFLFWGFGLLVEHNKTSLWTLLKCNFILFSKKIIFISP